MGNVLINNIEVGQQLSLHAAAYDMYLGFSVTPGTIYFVECEVMLGTATNFCVTATNSLGWNTVVGEKCWTPSDGLTTTHFTKITTIFTAPANGILNIQVGGHGESMTQQVAGTIFIKGLTITYNNGTLYALNNTPVWTTYLGSYSDLRAKAQIMLEPNVESMYAVYFDDIQPQEVDEFSFDMGSAGINRFGTLKFDITVTNACIATVTSPSYFADVSSLAVPTGSTFALSPGTNTMYVRNSSTTTSNGTFRIKNGMNIITSFISLRYSGTATITTFDFDKIPYNCTVFEMSSSVLNFTGEVSAVKPLLPALTRFKQTANSANVDIQYLPSVLTYFYSPSPQDQLGVHGNLSLLPSGITHFEARARIKSFTYPTTRTWATPMSSLNFTRVGTTITDPEMSEADFNRLLVDLDTALINSTYITGSLVFTDWLQTPTGTGLTAYNSLVAKGITITI